MPRPKRGPDARKIRRAILRVNGGWYKVKSPWPWLIVYRMKRSRAMAWIRREDLTAARARQEG